MNWCFFIFYMALCGSFCGLEIDTFIGNLPFFQISTLLLFFNVLFVILIPPAFYMLAASIQRLWANRAARTCILVLNAIYFLLIAFFSLYKAIRHMDFDFYFFWYNTADTLPVIWKLFAPWLLVIVLSMAGFVMLQKLAFSPMMNIFRKSPRKVGILLTALFVSSLFCQLATLHTIRGSTTGFLYASFLSDHRLRNDYSELYRKHIALRQSVAPKASGQDDPSLGDVIFFIKQESLNGLLVNPRITPQFLRASRDGILFKKLYANSIQSVRSYGCILCGVPPSVTAALADVYTAKELNALSCLPKVFRSHGYHSLYFFGGSRNPRIVHFAESIGFEKVLADDIVKPGDVKFNWGYREDVFFARVHEYIQKHYPNDKLFVFIDTGATNHTPFKVHDPLLLDKVPFPRPKKFEEHLANTTFAQDAYFGGFYDIFKKYYAHRGSLVALSDHSWPIPIHNNNIYNERGAYEENFLISMLFVPPSSSGGPFATGTTVDYRFSQTDILPTFLDLIGLEEKQLLGESFAPWLLTSQNNERSGPRKTKVSVQPYDGGFISVVRYPKKYLFDVLGGNVKVFDLERDPGELSPDVHRVEDYMFLIKDYFQNNSSLQ